MHTHLSLLALAFLATCTFAAHDVPRSVAVSGSGKASTSSLSVDATPTQSISDQSDFGDLLDGPDGFGVEKLSEDTGFKREMRNK
ncbi:hypothetical protein DENSPDRAFT_880805 [Dentipellis sp. KUC8613]|nr:hypothetical protein DENSPDRAFT_880805 [Dentipellis sp. KUC8613]